MLFWIICAALTILVVGAILLPFRRQEGTVIPDSPAAYDLQVYRDQLREVDRDLARGIIAADDADRLRAEIGRKVLEADRKLTLEAAKGPRKGGALVGAALIALLLAGGAFGIYWREGVPGLRDLPLSARLAEAEQLHTNRPSQAELETVAPTPPEAAPVDPQFAQLIEQLRQAVARNPEDPQGLTLLAQNEARLGNLTAAREAQEKLITLRGDQANAAELTQLAALMVQATGGIVSPEAEALIDRALAADPHYPQARYVQGILYAQNARPDLTFRIWAGLLEQGPADAPWIGPIRESIEDLAWIAGEPNYQPPTMGAAMGLSGPTAGQMADAQMMTPEERQQMIAGMVEGLEARLTTQGGTAQEWVRLISSLKVIGQDDRAAQMADLARAAYADQPDALTQIEAAASAQPPADGAPMTAPMAGDAPGPSAEDIQAAGDMTAEQRQRMVQDMVQRLESRLATQGGTADEWARLISALMVVGNEAHARDILAEARQRFADHPESLAVIDAAAQSAGITE
ncbi:MAG: c-type cytochrome biogenesis protein CcmI [Paracoccus sp. (in: a-proteobacteria)]|uniref:c-type cytochrome biogenesis protein CcmI n=1 Tax=Paracoccus sp. TaxID=267 RepID=UPI0026E0296B|nr:c-type cytochrome biogenesis protein CcmI [Paracoccus sp. (in: a-proteobacteria)]MDO5630698.1 c-type cytochrome biogenesis protein CcmI [Paracoccus sp. (in: a-proteobacteria)]